MQWQKKKLATMLADRTDRPLSAFIIGKHLLDFLAAQMMAKMENGGNDLAEPTSRNNWTIVMCVFRRLAANRQTQLLKILQICIKLYTYTYIHWDRIVKTYGCLIFFWQYWNLILLRRNIFRSDRKRLE